MSEKLIENRMPRSFFGKLVKWTFILFNGFMMLWLITGFNQASEKMERLASDAEQIGATIGTGIGAAIIIGIWIAGVIILTPILFLTKGKRVFERIES